MFISLCHNPGGNKLRRKVNHGPSALVRQIGGSRGWGLIQLPRAGPPENHVTDGYIGALVGCPSPLYPLLLSLSFSFPSSLLSCLFRSFTWPWDCRCDLGTDCVFLTIRYCTWPETVCLTLRLCVLSKTVLGRETGSWPECVLDHETIIDTEIV